MLHVHPRTDRQLPGVGECECVSDCRWWYPCSDRLLNAIGIVYAFQNGDASLYSELFAIWEAGTKTLASIESLQLILQIQCHPVTNGTNSFGLPAGEKNLVLSVLTAAYTNAADDDTVRNGMQAIINQYEEILRARGLYIPVSIPQLYGQITGSDCQLWSRCKDETASY